MNLILQAIKSLFRKLENKIDKDIVSNRSDWEQNDENGAGYIKNRPFYCKEIRTDILPVGNYLTIDYDGAVLYEFNGNLIEGVEYVVTFGDIVENRLAVADQSGKVSLEASNKIDLRIQNKSETTMSIITWDYQGGKTYRIGITAITNETKQIDAKYLPNSAKSFVVTVRYVDRAWQISHTNAEIYDAYMAGKHIILDYEDYDTGIIFHYSTITSISARTAEFITNTGSSDSCFNLGIAEINNGNFNMGTRRLAYAT